jgi:SPP1 gp7 family putative phage head morphogenesis protein
MSLSRVSTKERQQAELQSRDTAKLQIEGVRAAKVIANRIERSGVVALRSGRKNSIIEVVRREINALHPLVMRAMTAAHLRGVYRTDVTRPQRSISFSRKTQTPNLKTTFNEAISFLSDRLDVNRRDLRKLSNQYEAQALEVVRRASAKVEKQLQKTILDITDKRLHVKEAVKQLKQTFDNTGLSPRNSFELEAIFRTQTQLAYSAGRWNADKDPDIQEILWGYKYVTVGDDRVRLEHAALEGMTLEKNDPRWNTMFPPNGWACRCQAIPIFEEREIVEPPTLVEVDGKLITPGPDKGFAYNPGEILGKLKDIKDDKEPKPKKPPVI